MVSSSIANFAFMFDADAHAHESWEGQLQVFRQRIIQLESINVELEHRLEKQAKERMEVCSPPVCNTWFRQE